MWGDWFEFEMEVGGGDIDVLGKLMGREVKIMNVLL